MCQNQLSALCQLTTLKENENEQRVEVAVIRICIHCIHIYIKLYIICIRIQCIRIYTYFFREDVKGFGILWKRDLLIPILQ